MRHIVEVYVDGAVKAGIPVWGCLFMRDGVPVDADGGLSPTRGTSKARIDFAEYHPLIKGLQGVKMRAWDQDVVTLSIPITRLSMDRLLKRNHPRNYSHFTRKLMN